MLRLLKMILLRMVPDDSLLCIEDGAIRFCEDEPCIPCFGEY